MEQVADIINGEIFIDDEKLIYDSNTIAYTASGNDFTGMRKEIFASAVIDRDIYLIYDFNGKAIDNQDLPVYELPIKYPKNYYDFSKDFNNLRNTGREQLKIRMCGNSSQECLPWDDKNNGFIIKLTSP